MQIKRPQQFECFSDGVCDIYETDENAQPTAIKYHLCFSNRVVGVKRFFAAAAAQVEINAIIRVLQRLDISSHDIVKINGKTFYIEQVQHIGETMPPVSDLSLRQIEMHWGNADEELLQR